MAKKTKYVRTIRQTTATGGVPYKPCNMVATVRGDLISKHKGCIVIQFAGSEPEDFNLAHLEYITEKEHFLKSLRGPNKIE